MLARLDAKQKEFLGALLALPEHDREKLPPNVKADVKGVSACTGHAVSCCCSGDTGHVA